MATENSRRADAKIDSMSFDFLRKEVKEAGEREPPIMLHNCLGNIIVDLFFPESDDTLRQAIYNELADYSWSYLNCVHKYLHDWQKSFEPDPRLSYDGYDFSIKLRDSLALITELAKLSDGTTYAIIAFRRFQEDIFNQFWTLRDSLNTVYARNDELMIMFDETLLDICKRDRNHRLQGDMHLELLHEHMTVWIRSTRALTRYRQRGSKRRYLFPRSTQFVHAYHLEATTDLLVSKTISHRLPIELCNIIKNHLLQSANFVTPDTSTTWDAFSYPEREEWGPSCMSDPDTACLPRSSIARMNNPYHDDLLLWSWDEKRYVRYHRGLKTDKEHRAWFRCKLQPQIFPPSEVVDDNHRYSFIDERPFRSHLRMRWPKRRELRRYDDSTDSEMASSLSPTEYDTETSDEGGFGYGDSEDEDDAGQETVARIPIRKPHRYLPGLRGNHDLEIFSDET